MSNTGEITALMSFNNMGEKPMKEYLTDMANMQSAVIKYVFTEDNKPYFAIVALRGEKLEKRLKAIEDPDNEILSLLEEVTFNLKGVYETKLFNPECKELIKRAETALAYAKEFI